VLQKVAKLEELDKVWSLDDMARANALLDMRQSIDEEQARHLEKKKR
jgi:ABC-type uncharacterized transport system substrate-binding protein